MSNGFQRTLDHIRSIADSEAHKGRLFERLMKTYFGEDPVCKGRFSQVWLWSEWASIQPGFDGTDTGIDLVAEEREGGYCAIQCKCYAPGTQISKPHLDSFIAASARDPFTARIMVDTGDEWGLALNMPAGINPALARAVGVMLKNAWLQALLMRPAKMKATPGRYFRPAGFICDEYQAFASVGEDDPSGDEKSFALTRQCRCIPIVATQSISSLRAVLGSSEAWRSLLQTLRTRIFLSLSDDASAKIASELCGQVAKIKESYTISETSKRSEVSPLSGRAGGGGGSMGATKSFREQREAVFHPRDFALLSNCQAICLPYDGAQSLEPRRVYLKPHYLPAEHSYWRAKEAGQI